MTARMTVDPVELELFKNAIFSAADEMALTIYRTAYSASLKDNMDYSTALFDARGRLVSQGLTLPAHLGTMPGALAAIIATFETIHEGDVFALNDPYQGGMHLPDIFVFKPIFHNGARVAFAGSVCHHTDVGGRVPGSMASDSTEIFQEGLRIPPVKLYDRGTKNETLFALLGTNVRVPKNVFGDLRAQLAACHIGEAAILDLAQRMGAEVLGDYMNELLEYAERMTRAAIRTLPDGEFTFEDHIDDDGVNIGEPILLKVKVTKNGDGIVVDWTGSAAQVAGALNSTLSYTESSCFCVIRCILPGSIPNNEGVFRPIQVIAPEGTITNAVLPAAVAARALTGYRLVDCLFGALAKMAPEKVFAACDGGNTGVAIGGYDANRKPFIFIDFTCGAWGARPYADGLDGNANISVNTAAQSIEVIESEQPVQIVSYAYIQDGMGPGKFRGGAPTRREYRFLENAGVMQVRSDRRAFRPYGLYGGQPGSPSMNYLNPDDENKLLNSKFTMPIKHGTVFRHEIAGGGGWGDPLERDTLAVLQDVRNEFVSLDAAREQYGVVIEPSPLAVDADATTRLRNATRAARGWKSVPDVSWEPMVTKRRIDKKAS